MFSFIFTVTPSDSLAPSAVATVTAVVCCVVATGLSCEPGGPALLLEERQTSVQEARPRHQRVEQRAARQADGEDFYRCV